uniref:UspA domain-containing protein n=1 Tax=Vannella robusta TaxID=1487602 RepID=A0A7S4IK05_9EUKA|mmetsp:Transcript_3702/g.4585  ORF Transcript_3702/g.4585 Transcript_3702/m.4585 type:complete len:161 (+) Transcript_3702:128-610(+)
MKILLAIDDSVPSQKAFEFVLHTAKPTDEIILLAVAETTVASVAIPFASTVTSIVDIDQSVQKHLREVLKGYGKQLVLKGLRHTCLLGKGASGETICEEAEYRKADLVVIGRRKLSSISRAMVGSVSTYTLHNAPCAVMVVKTDCGEEEKKERQNAEVVE